MAKFSDKVVFTDTKFREGSEYNKEEGWLCVYLDCARAFGEKFSKSIKEKRGNKKS